MRVKTHDLWLLTPEESQELYRRLQLPDALQYEHDGIDLTKWRFYTSSRLEMAYDLVHSLRDIEDLLTVTHYIIRQRSSHEFPQFKTVSTFYNCWMTWLVINKKVRYVHVNEDNQVWVS